MGGGIPQAHGRIRLSQIWECSANIGGWIRSGTTRSGSVSPKRAGGNGLFRAPPGARPRLQRDPLANWPPACGEGGSPIWPDIEQFGATSTLCASSGPLPASSTATPTLQLARAAARKRLRLLFRAPEERDTAPPPCRGVIEEGVRAEEGV